MDLPDIRLTARTKFTVDPLAETNLHTGVVCSFMVRFGSVRCGVV